MANKEKRIMVDMSATIIHHGHIRLLKKASKYGKVIVGLTSDKEIKSKKGYTPELAFKYRKEVLEAIKYVDEVVVTPWLLTDETLEKYNIDLLVHGSDNSNEIAKDKLLVFPRTQGISSTDIRKRACEIIKVKENNVYDIWNEVKKETNNQTKKRSFEERDIIYIKMGKNIGFEQDGKGNEFLRPILVYKKFNSDQFIGFAMTSQKPKEQNMKYYYKLKDNSYIILSQVRTYSAKRMSHIIGKISKQKFNNIKEKFYKLVTPSELRGGPYSGNM